MRRRRCDRRLFLRLLRARLLMTTTFVAVSAIRRWGIPPRVQATAFATSYSYFGHRGKAKGVSLESSSRKTSGGRRLLTSFPSTDNGRTDDYLVDSIEACWKATTWTVNGHDNEEINERLQCFQSPAPQNYFAFLRALDQTRSLSEYQSVLEIFSYVLKPGYAFLMMDPSETADDDIGFQMILENDIIASQLITAGKKKISKPSNYQHTLEISHAILDLATKASEENRTIDQSQVDELVSLALKRLKITLGTDIRGRSSADVAFNLATAGVNHPAMYETLAAICQHELQRIGGRPSFPSKNILQIVEKLAAAGYRPAEINEIHSVAADYLEEKGESHKDVIELLRRGDFDLHATRSLLWLWRFAARQTKVKPSMEPDMDCLSTEHCEFENPETRPLVVDVGCGMGVSLLGLATLTRREVDEGIRRNYLPRFLDSNFLGGDLSPLLVNYSRQMSNRWGISSRIQFVCRSAEHLVDSLESYPGPLGLIMIQFPTPYRFNQKGEGSNSNQQLPDDISSGFMVTPRLIQKISKVLAKKGGKLLFQTNCEDVAVTIRHMVEKDTPLTCVSVYPSLEKAAIGKDLPQRTRDWIQAGGERAVGQGWSCTPLLPRRGQTETEVACELQGTPVHRCLFEHTGNR